MVNVASKILQATELKFTPGNSLNTHITICLRGRGTNERTNSREQIAAKLRTAGTDIQTKKAHTPSTTILTKTFSSHTHTQRFLFKINPKNDEQIHDEYKHTR